MELFYYSVNASDLTFTNVKDEWIYVVGTYDGTTQKLYVDGSLSNSQSTSQTISTTTNARIGTSSYIDLYPFNGNLANVAIWNRALSSDEINSVMWKEPSKRLDECGIKRTYKRGILWMI